MALVGLDDLHFSILTNDDSTGVTYSTITPIPGAITVDMQPQSNTNTLYADNSPFAVATAFGGVTVSLEIAALPLEIRAQLLGHEVKDGLMFSKADDVAPYVALMFKSLKHNDSYRYVKLLKGKFNEPQETPTTKTDSPEFATPTIEGNFVSREYDKKWAYMADTDNTNFTGADTWFDSVDPTEECCDKVKL